MHNRGAKFGKPSKRCNDCGNSYTNDRSHRETCLRKKVSCVYPDPNSDGRGERVVLYRGEDRYFKCLRCGKALMKIQNMKKHTRECHGTGKGMEAAEIDQPVLPPAPNSKDVTSDSYHSKPPHSMSNSDELVDFTVTTPIPAQITATAGPFRAVNEGRAANALLSVHSDGDDAQEEPNAKGSHGGTDGMTATGTLNGKRKKDEDPETADDVQSGREAKKRWNRGEGEELEQETWPLEQVQGVSPPAAAKGIRGPIPRPGEGEGTTPRGEGTKDVSIIDLDEVELLDFEEGHARAEVENLASVINASLRPPKQGNTRTKQASSWGADDECAILREQLQQAQSHIEDLKRLHQVRTTETELLLQRMEAQHQRDQQGSEALINDLRKQLAQKDSLLRTNEEANRRETQALRDQVKTYQVAILERDQTVKERDEEISGFKRANRLSSQKQLNFASRQCRGLGQIEDRKMAEVVQFYEDLTNLLVTDIKPQPGRPLQLGGWLLTCVYSYRDVVDMRSPAKTFSFKLQQCFEPNVNLQGESIGESDLVESLQYTPFKLEKETEEFVESVGFLNNPFIFDRDQLSLFLQTLHDVVSGDKWS